MEQVVEQVVVEEVEDLSDVQLDLVAGGCGSYSWL